MKRRRRFRWKLHSAALLLTFGCAGAALAVGGDSVTRKGGHKATGLSVLREGYDKVEVDRDDDGKADESFPADQVEEVTYHDAPMSFRRGLGDFTLLRFGKAAEYFTKALEEKNVRSFWLQQHANYLLGECHRKLARGDKKLLAKARQAYARAIEKVPDGRLVPFAIQGTGICLVAEGKTDAARREFEKLSAGGKYGETWTLRGKLLLAQIYSKTNKHKEALALCDEVAKLTQAPEFAHLRPEVSSARATVFMAAGKHAEARRIFTQAARATAERDVTTKARAYNAVADCFLGEKRTREALLAYLRVRVLYFKDKEELAHALYGAARCFTILRKPKEAHDLVMLLKKDYPDSQWTVKAMKEFAKEATPPQK